MTTPTRIPWKLLGFTLAGAFPILCCAVLADENREDVEFFERRIRPVLVEQCFQCHGSTRPKGGLRLDHRQAILQGGDSGPALIPGDAKESLLMKAIRHDDDPGYKMPPKKKLSDEQIKDFGRWIARGAPWPSERATPSVALAADRDQFWAIRPLPRAPANAASATSDRTIVDRWIAQRLTREGLSMSPPADRRTFLRRLSFDLTGLPPTMAEVEGFEKDRRPEAVAVVVDRLLQSPHFGEKWARHWLDIVRYAETDGHEFDVDKPNAWRYRDYVIRAFNDDLPYDQFVREQIAGDKMDRLSKDGRSRESVLGTGFFWLGEQLNSPVDGAVARADQMENQLDTFGKTFFALTVGCCRCHDHKFDPLPAKDYYALAGFLLSSRMEQTCLDAPATRRSIQDLSARKEELRAMSVQQWWSEAGPHLASAPARLTTPGALKLNDDAKLFESFDDQSLPGWTILGPAFEQGAVLPRVDVDDNGSIRVIASPAGGRFVDSGRISKKLTGSMRTPVFRIERNFLHVLLAGGRGRDTSVRLTVEGYQEPGLVLPAGGDYPFQWRVLDCARWHGQDAFLELVDLSETSFLAADAMVFSSSPIPPAIPNIEIETSAARTGIDQSLTRGGIIDRPEMLPLLRWLEHKVPRAPLSERDRHSRRELENALPRSTFGLATADERPADAPFQVRGNPKTLGPPVPRRALSLMASDSTIPHPRAYGGVHESGRLELAHEMTEEAAPLLARVMVNRLWQGLFGQGIVRTPNDFGRNGASPTHPELLDELARLFIANNWSIKSLLRILATSETYAQASDRNDRSMEKDPDNKWWGRMPVRRLDAEMMRDAILATSGSLDRTLFGPSVPTMITPFMDGRGRPGSSGPIDGARRRSVYLEVRRNFLNPMFMAFDYPAPIASIGKRTRSTVPSQALLLMNSAFVDGQARAWSDRVLSTHKDREERIEQMIRDAFARPARPDERQRCSAFVETQARRYRETGEVDAEKKAWKDLAHALFETAEFLFLF